jgi:hypothetical protein
MSTEQLHRELAQIAERAPAAHVPVDTWQRARGSVRRTRIAAVAGAVSAVALVAGLVVWFPQRDGEIPVTDGAPGVPKVVHSVGWEELTPTSNLSVGQQAVVLRSPNEDPVVVDAEDGTYRALDLPGFEDSTRPLRLSPDGGRLAWGWSDGEGMGDAVGIRVLDLTTGEWESYDLRADGGGTFVTSFSFSPDGRWLVWSGQEAGAGQTGDVVAGRIGPDGESVRLPHPRPRTGGGSVFAVGDDGMVLVATADRVVRWDGEVIDTVARTGDTAPVVVTARDEVLVEATLDEIGEFQDYRLTSGTAVPEWEGRGVYPVGQLSDGTQVVLLGGTDEDRRATPPPDLRLQLLDPATGQVTTVGTMTADVADVAVGLMTSEPPTVSRSGTDAPEWLPDTSLLIGLGVAGVLLVLAGLRWLWRRYRAARYAS